MFDFLAFANWGGSEESRSPRTAPGPAGRGKGAALPAWMTRGKGEGRSHHLRPRRQLHADEAARARARQQNEQCTEPTTGSHHQCSER